MEKVKLGIVGLGRLGMAHASNISRNIQSAELAAVCSTVQSEIDAAKEQLGVSRGTADYLELFSDKSLDGIVIASNSAYHCRMICDAARSGVKHIFCEKPLGMTPQEIGLIKDVLSENHVKIFQIGYNRRFDRSLVTIKEKIDAGFIGKPILVKVINRDPKWDRDKLLQFSPTSGGLVFDMLSHDYDLVRWLVGSDAKTIYGIGGAFGYEGLAELNDIDNCLISMAFENGVMCSLETSRNASYGYHSELEVLGTDGMLRMGSTPNRDRVTSFGENGITLECVQGFFEFWEPTFLAELQDFADCIQHKKQPKVGFTDAYKAAQWAFAAKEAVAQRTVVTLPIQ